MGEQIAKEIGGVKGLIPRSLFPTCAGGGTEPSIHLPGLLFPSKIILGKNLFLLRFLICLYIKPHYIQYSAFCKDFYLRGMTAMFIFLFSVWPEGGVVCVIANSRQRNIRQPHPLEGRMPFPPPKKLKIKCVQIKNAAYGALFSSDVLSKNYKEVTLLIKPKLMIQAQ